MGPEGPLVINPGSLGCPWSRFDRVIDSQTASPHARYAIVDFDVSTRKSNVEFIALEYDWEYAASQAEAVGSPEWGWALRTGFFRRMAS